jgi:hypothetical protein
MQRGWSSPADGFVPVGIFQSTLEAVQNIKSELPNTRKRMSRATYRNFLITKNRKENYAAHKNKIEFNEKDLEKDPYYIQPSRVALSLHLPK